MPWSPVTVSDQREEFVRLADSPGVSLSELCRRFGISRKTGYKWLGRWQQQGCRGQRGRGDTSLISRLWTSPSPVEAPRVGSGIRQTRRTSR